MEWLRQSRGYFLLSLGWLLAFGAVTLVARWPRAEPIAIVAPASPPAVTVAAEALQVHVTGAVARPGVYRLSPGSRLVHAVEAAGGMAPDADPERINLADWLVDGQQVYVPRQGTPIPPLPTPVGRASSGGAGPAPAADGAAGVVNINTASAAELETLPGIGPALAQRIIAHREANGPFADPSEIVAVSGIGEATYAKLADRIVVR